VETHRAPGLPPRALDRIIHMLGVGGDAFGGKRLGYPFVYDSGIIKLAYEMLMTGYECADAVKAAWQQFMKCHAPGRMVGNTMQVHGKACQHTWSIARPCRQQQEVTAVV
jgi:hypothetical protein